MERLLLVALAAIFVSRGLCSLESVPDLANLMYKTVDGAPCVRRLSVFGEAGCANPGRDAVVAPIRRLTSLDIQSKDPITVLLPYSMFHVFLEKTTLDPSFASKVAGLLVESDPDFNNTLTSPDGSFPQAEFAPYPRKDYRWNPTGTNVLHKRYNFPVYLLSEDDTKALRKAASDNEARNANFPVNVAEFNAVMQTTKVGAHTSQACLEDLTCLPLGGFSVLSMVPPINVSAHVPPKPVLLVVAQMDSASFFRDLAPGADYPISGLIALLAAADALSKAGWPEDMEKQVVFSAFSGENWGYLGSRRFLAELEDQKDSIPGLNSSQIYQILEVGSVGHPIDNVFYAHNQEEQASPEVQEILDALKSSAQGLDGTLEMADKQNPGVPPSSLMTFLNKNSSFAGVVLEDFDKSFTNNAFHSHLDNADNVRVESITTASTILARTIQQLVSKNTTSITVSGTLVKELVECLLTPSPGMNCELVHNLMTPTQASANHYVGVYLGTPTDDTTRFVWNFLADRTKAQVGYSLPECSKSCEDPSQVCVGATAYRKGVCAFSTTRYVPAYSTRLRLGSEGTWELLPIVEGNVMDAVDPVWTESFWGTLSLRVYLREDPAVDRLVLLLGCGVTIGSSLVILTAKAVFHKRLKRA